MGAVGCPKGVLWMFLLATAGVVGCPRGLQL